MSALSNFSNGWIIKLFSQMGVPTFDDGTGKQVIYKREEVNLTGSGGYTGGTLVVVRFASTVSINLSATLTHASVANVSSASGAVPVWARPSILNMTNLYNQSGEFFRAGVTVGGFFSTDYNDEVGIGIPRTTSGSASITYNV